ncbi:MAG: DUF11 domain-containing protein [Deltaproteobacteria bacterium]|nr:DUF11 domain-containing protein [Deltaproteobacteria bacterium]
MSIRAQATGVKHRGLPRAAGSVLFALLCAGIVASAEAQIVRSFTTRFSITDHGNFIVAGNTLMTCPDSSSSCAAARAGTGGTLNNNNFTMVPVDVDLVDPGANSSSATLTIPSGSTVRFAGLYWGAISTNAARNQVRFRVAGAVTYNSLTASRLDVSGSFYQGFVDVTALVSAAGSGSYTVANVRANTGSNTAAGWSLVVVYSNATETARNLTVFDGFANVSSSSGTVNIPVSGFLTPPSGPVNTQLGVVAYEGDLGTTGDAFRLNGVTLSDARNPAANFFNSTVSVLGAHVTDKTPNYVNQLGFDIDSVDASGILANSATSATITLTTAGDQYLPGAVVFATPVYAPVIVPNALKTVTDVNGGYVEAGDVLEYSIPVTNTGDDYADNVILTDAIPSDTTYVAGSLVVTSGANAGAKTDASGDDQAERDVATGRVVFRLGTGATAAAGGSLAPDASTGVRFRVQIGAGVANGAVISNTGRLIYTARLLGTTDSLDTNTATTQLNRPDLTVVKSHAGNFVRGASGNYQVVVTNSGFGPTSGSVAMTDTLPAGLTPTAASGTGWACSIASQLVTCSRSDALAASASYAAISIDAAVSQSAGASLVNTASVSGGSELNLANNSSSDTTAIVSSADLSITKTGPAAVVPGSNLVYTVTVTNNGASDATAVSVADPTPTGLTFVSNAGNCTTAYPCALGAVAAGATRTITTTYFVPSAYTTPAPIVNTATVSSSTTDPVSGNNSATASTPLSPPYADLSITKTGPVSATPGANLVYTVTVTNNGISDAVAASVADTTPTGLTFVSNAGNCTTSYPCALGTIASGATRTITTTYSLPSSYTTPTPIVNTATVSSSTSDPASGNNSSTSSTPVVASADVSVTKTGPASATPGTNVVYTATVTNNGSSDATSVSVSDATPTGLTFVSNAGDCTTAYPCLLGTIASGATRTITTTYSMPASYTTPSPVLNLATVASATSDPVSGNNSSTSSTPVVASADLSITKTGPASATPGANLVYTVTVTNNGSSDAASVSVADPTPAGLTFVSNAGNCTTAYPCSLGTVATGATRTITTTYSIPSSYTTPAPIVNTATVSAATSDPASGNNSSTSSTPVSASADLSIVKTGPASATPGATLAYTVTVTNNGSSDATSVSVADPTPAGLIFVSNAGNCATAYPCSLGTVAAGATRTITTTYSIPSSYTTPAPIVNTATVSSATTDPVAGNNSSTSSTPVSASADLSIVKTGPASATPGADLVYTVTVSNNGSSDAAAVSVADTTPSGLTFVSNAGYCTTSYPCVLGTVAAGTTRTVTTTYSVPSSYTTPAPIVNSATVSSSTTDPVAGNNSSMSSTPVVASADLEVSKTGPASATPGTNLVYTVTVHNHGSSDATSTSVADPTPVGLTFVSNAGDCTTAYPCSLGTLVSGDSYTITTTYSVPSSYTTPDPIVNTATVSSAASDPVPGDNSSTSSTPVSASADLSIVKTGPASATTGTNLVYTVTVTNNGTSDAAAVSVADPTPAGLSFVSNAGDCTTAYPCALGTVASGATRTITTTYLVPSAYTTPDPIQNTASVSSSTTDPASGNNSSTSSTPVSTSADLSILKAGPVSVVAGESLIYTITVTNAGSSDAASVSVTDPTPAGLTFVSNAGDCTTAFPCSFATVAAGATRTITATYSVPSSYTTPDPIVNSASVASTTTDPVAGNNTSTSSTAVVSSADLSITKTGPGGVTPGTNLVYTVTVANNGSSDAVSVSVADPTPAGLTFVSNAGDCATAYPCALGTVASGTTRTITTTYSVPPSYTTPDPILNTATVSSATTDPAPANNSQTASTALSATVAELGITKTGPASVTPGTNGVYTVTVVNNGPSDASSAQVTDPTPAGLTFVSNAGDCTTAYPCSFGTIPLGATRTITTTFSVPASYTAPDPIVNIATVASGDADPVSGNDNSSASSAVVPSADLSILKTGPASVVAGGNLVYTITVTNAGSSDAAAVSVADPTPAGLTFVSNTGDCTTAYPCSLGTAPVGSTHTITTTYSVPSAYTSPDPIQNTATVSSSTADPDSGNNTSASSTSVSVSADVSITKSGPASATAGTSLVYTVTVTNSGSSDAASVSVTDPTPTGLTFVSNTGDCATAYPCALGTLTAGATRTITTTYSVPSSYTTPTPIVNTASVSSSTSDPVPGNNSSTSSTPLSVSADLSITKSGPAAATAGENVTFTITVTNLGSSDATSVSVADPTPDELTFVSNTGDCATAYPCALGTLAAGATSTITTTYSVMASHTGPHTIVNTATVSSATTDPVSGNNSSTSSTPVMMSADVSITKTGPASATAGANVVYTVTVTNAGSSDAAAVVVDDPTPAGLTFVSSTGDCTGAYPCTLGTLIPGVTRTITSTYAVPSSYTTPAPIVNIATVSSGTDDPAPGNNSSTSSTAVVVSADLAITKTGPASAFTGADLVYTVTITNLGSADAVSVNVGDPTPAGLTFVSNSGSCATAYPCALGTVAPGATRTITTTYAVPASYTTPNPIVNTATVSSSTADPAAANNTATSSTPVSASADLSITKTGPGTSVVGGSASYSITVTNAGPSSATGVVVTDVLDPATAYVTSSVACTGGPAGPLSCNLGTIAPAASTTFTVAVSISSSATDAGTLAGGPCDGSEDLCNQASVAGASSDPDTSDNSVTEATDLVVAILLSLSKSDSPDPVAPGGTLQYVLSYSNDTDTTFTNVQLTEIYDPLTSFVSATPPPDLGNDVWVLGDLEPGDTGEVVITVDVAGGLADGVVLANTGVLSADLMNDVAEYEETVVAAPGADTASLSVVKSVSPARIPSGGLVTYSVTVANGGPAQAYAVVVHDVLPEGLSYLNALPAPSAVVGSDLTWDAGDLAAGASQSFTIFAESDAQLPAGAMIDNTATADGVAGPGTSDTAGLHAEGSAVSTATGPGTECRLVMKKRHVGIPKAGGEIVYRCLWADPCGTAQGVQIVDSLPDQLEVKSVSSREPAHVSGSVVTFDIGTLAAGRAGLAYITVKIADDVAPGTVVSNSIAITDAALRRQVGTDEFVVGGASGPWLKLSGPKRAYSGSRVQYMLRYDRVGQGGSISCVVTDGMNVESVTPPPTSIVDGVMTWDNVWTSGVIKLRGTAQISDPDVRGAILSVDATAIAASGESYSQGIDTALLAGSPGEPPAAVGPRPLTVSFTGARYVTAGLSTQFKMRYRFLSGKGEAVLSLPEGLDLISAAPAPTLIEGRKLTFRDIRDGNGTVAVRANVDGGLATGTRLAVGTTILADPGGSVGAEFEMTVR